MKQNYFRSILLGALLCIGISFLEPYAIHVLNDSPLAADFSTGGAILFLFILVFFVNSLWRLTHRKSSLASDELCVIYIMLIIACSIISWGFVLNLLPLLAGLQYYASPMNNWQQAILSHIPKYLLPQGEAVVRTFYEGLPKNAPIPWGAWVTPLAAWTSFILAVYFLMLSVYTFFRKTWITDERLLFPLVQLPLALTEEPAPGSIVPAIFKNRLFWLGVAIPFIFYSLKALHNYFPIAPRMDLSWSIPIMRRNFGIPLHVYFEVIGLTFLLTTNLSLGIWLFAIYAAFLTGYTNMVGYSIGPVEPVSDPSGPVVAHQVYGAMVAFVLYLTWRNRRHIRDIFLKAIGKKPEVDDSEELFSYRTTVFGSIIAFFYLVFWMNRMGVNLVGSIFYLVVAYIVFIGLTRAVTQGGVAYGRPPVAPFFTTIDTLGSNFLGPSGITGIGLQDSWSADARTFVMASAANASKITSERKLKARKVALAIGVAVVVTLLATYVSGLRLAYRFGGLNTYAWHYTGIPQFWGQAIYNKIAFPAGPQKMILLFDLLGAVLMSAFIFMQNRFLWWPIHPLGLAIGSTSPSLWVWFSVFLGWFFKYSILHLGGIGTYRRVLPLFLGLILGGFLAAGFWIGIDSLTGMTGNIFTLG